MKSTKKPPRWRITVLTALLFAAAAAGGYCAGYFSVDREAMRFLPRIYGSIESIDTKAKTMVVDAREMSPDKTLRDRFLFKITDDTRLRRHTHESTIFNFKEGDCVEITWMGPRFFSDPCWLSDVKMVVYMSDSDLDHTITP